jgi:hypothetical protein
LRYLQRANARDTPAGKSTTTGRTITTFTPPARLGAVRATLPRIDRPPVTQSYAALSRVIKESGLLRRTPWFYGLLVGGLTLALGGAITGFVLLGDSWFQLLIAAALGIIFTQFAFFAHEASHRAVFDGGRANDRVGRIVATSVVGISYQWWMTKHTRHHANPNQIDKDPDIAFDTISFTEESAAEQRGLLRWITQRQGWLFFPLLLLEGLNLHVTSIRSLFERRAVPGRALELGLIAARLGLYVGVVFWFLPLGMAFAFLGVQLAVFGVYMGASFAPNHKGMPLVPAGAKLDFLSKQVLTSRNITGRWTSPHLAKAREIVREHCRSLGIPYTETTLARSYAIVVDYLNRVGLAARDPFDCPAAGEMRRR